MGKKGEKRTGAAASTAEDAVKRLQPIGGVTSRGMFGGYGLFVDGVMFGLVNSKGEFHLRVDDSTRANFEKTGSQSHGKMPYFSVPNAVLKSDEDFCSWASKALSVARAAKKK